MLQAVTLRTEPTPGVFFAGLAASARKAARDGLRLLVIGVVMVKYSSTTPTDDYIRSVDATVYQTGRPESNAIPSTQDLTGVKAATWSTTDHKDNGAGNGASGDGG